MNLLVIVHEYPPDCGGGGIHVSGMVKELSRSHSVTVIIPRSRQKLPSDSWGNIIRVPTIGRVNAETQSRLWAYIGFASFMLSATLTGLLLSYKQHFDFIHSYFAVPAGFIGMVIGKLRHIPHMVTLIEADIFDPQSRCTRPYRGFLRKIIRGIINSAAVRTAISRYIADAAGTHYAITRPLSVVTPGIPATAPFSLTRKNNDNPLPKLSIVSAGRLVERKDFVTLITAFSRMTFRQGHLTIIGDGPMLDDLKQSTRRLQVADRVIFTGYVPDEEKYRIMRAADIFALTSVHEGFGIVIAEAMNCGLPVVSTDAGGQRDLVAHGENGFLAPPGDIAALAEHLDSLACDTALRRRMGMVSLSRAPRFYNSTIGEQYAALMESQEHR